MKQIESLINLLKRIKEKGKLEFLSEDATKLGIILPILQCLEWEIFDTDIVVSEHKIGSNRVDYALFHKGKPTVFIEAKRIDEDLEKHQAQLLKYSFEEGVKLAVLTNGKSWWLYLPLSEGSWEQRKFYALGLLEQDVEKLAQKFVEFLSKDNVLSGDAIKKAESELCNLGDIKTFAENLPIAWNKLIEEADEILIELLAEKCEEICGKKPEDDTISKFILSFNKPLIEKKVYKVENIKEEKTPTKIPTLYKSTYINTTITSFVFEGKKYLVSTWKDLLVKMCELMKSSYGESFDRVLAVKGPRKPYFSNTEEDLRAPYLISGTKIYVETNLNAGRIVKVVQRMINLFGKSESGLQIENK